MRRLESGAVGGSPSGERASPVDCDGSGGASDDCELVDPADYEDTETTRWFGAFGELAARIWCAFNSVADGGSCELGSLRQALEAEGVAFGDFREWVTRNRGQIGRSEDGRLHSMRET